MSKDNIHFYNKKVSLNISFLELSEEFPRTCHGKRAIGVQVIEGLL